MERRINNTQTPNQGKPANDHVVLNMDHLKPQTPKTHLKAAAVLPNFSKPKSRFTEPNHRTTTTVEPQHLHSSTSSDDEDEDDDEWFEKELEDDDGITIKKYTDKRKKIINKRAAIEWTLFLLITTCLIFSLTLPSLKHEVRYGLEVWKWCLMVMVVFCGRLVAGWVIGFAVFLIERNFMLRERVLYFVYGLRKSFQNCVWLALVLVAWALMFHNVRERSTFLKKVFRFLVAVLIGATVWLLKILLVKILASSFHVATFFDRMKESVFHHYVLDALSGPPLEEGEREAPRRKAVLEKAKSMPADVHVEIKLTESKSARKIDMKKLRKLSMKGRATAWSVKRLVSYVRSSGLSTISRTVDDFAKAESEINSEWDARNCAKRIFKNVAKPAAKYIEEEDLLKFLRSEEVHTIFPLFEGAPETGRITKSSFRNWVVHAYIERKALAHSLNDTKTAVHQLHKLASAIVCVIIVVISLLVMGLATTKVLLVVTSQLLLVGFMFQNTCKTMFESIIFVFVMHPFDAGDRCVIDGVQMIVEEMNILTTVFLRYDMEKIYYPNSELLKKPISNFRRSPEMGDTLEFSIDFCTSVDDFNALKKAIQSYIESKPKYWSPKHSVISEGNRECGQDEDRPLLPAHDEPSELWGEKPAKIGTSVRDKEDLREPWHQVPSSSSGSASLPFPASNMTMTRTPIL